MARLNEEKARNVLSVLTTTSDVDFNVEYILEALQECVEETIPEFTPSDWEQAVENARRVRRETAAAVLARVRQEYPDTLTAQWADGLDLIAEEFGVEVEWRPAAEDDPAGRFGE